MSRCFAAGRSFAAVLLFGSLVAPGICQAGNPTPQVPTEGTTPAQEPKYARILADGAQLRCWPSAVVAPPVFEDVLTKDQVVTVGRSESGFRAVSLPLGPTGYVNKKFAVTDEAGRVRSKGAKVAFRYRPKTTEAPVAQLADSTELFVIGEQDDWWRVRVEAIEAWLPEAEVQVVDQPDAAMKAAFGEMKQKYEAEIQARLDQIAAAKVQEEKNKGDEAAVQIMQDAFVAELKKPVAAQTFEPIETALDKLDASLAKESSAKNTIASLRQRIQAQKWIVEATAVRDAKPVPAPDVLPVQPKDELERFQSIGWLRYESRLAGVGTYYLEKGGVRQHLLSCSSGRYDLALFVGREVGVNGPRRRPATESLSVLDVERLEVLGGLKP
jgi:SH3-like domain-containing protein